MTTRRNRLALLSAEEFARAWGSSALVRLPRNLENAPIPADASDFLVKAGLPALVEYWESGPLKVTFCRLAGGLTTVLKEPTVGPPLPSEWSVYWVAGDEFFCNGAAWWCIHQETGAVHRIDIETETPIEFVNSTVAHLATSLQLAVVWSSQCDRTPQKWPLEVNRFRRQLEELDSPCMRSNKNFWWRYLDIIRDEGPQAGHVKPRSRSGGRRALQRGPW